VDFEQIAKMGANVFSADSQLAVTFYNGAKLNQHRTDESGGVPQYDDCVFVKIVVPGDTFNIIDQPAWIDERHPNAHNNRFKRQWEAFKANQKASAVAGVPIVELPALAESQRKTLAFLNVETVEQLANLPDDKLTHILGGQELRKRAQLYLRQREDAQLTAKLDAEAQRQKAEKEKLALDLAEVQAQLAELKKAKPEAKK
jgi:hypothetical protein